jgi:predicted aspartyl protease
VARSDALLWDKTPILAARVGDVARFARNSAAARVDLAGMATAKTRITLTNHADLELDRRGFLAAPSVRSAEVEALVDTGASPLVLPPLLAVRLGLHPEGRRKIRYADGRSVDLLWVSGVRLEILGRAMSCDALVEPFSSVPRVGQLVLATLDLTVDLLRGTLDVNPASPDLPLVDLLPVSWASAALA